MIKATYAGAGHDRLDRTWSIRGKGRVTSQGPYGPRRQDVVITFDDGEIDELVRFIAAERIAAKGIGTGEH